MGAGGLRVEDGGLHVVFEFRKPVEALSLRPRSGYAGGGSVARIDVRHATSSTGCAFGDALGVSRIVSTALILCEASPSESSSATRACG